MRFFFVLLYRSFIHLFRFVHIVLLFLCIIFVLWISFHISKLRTNANSLLKSYQLPLLLILFYLVTVPLISQSFADLFISLFYIQFEWINIFLCITHIKNKEKKKIIITSNSLLKTRAPIPLINKLKKRQHLNWLK